MPQDECLVQKVDPWIAVEIGGPTLHVGFQILRLAGGKHPHYVRPQAAVAGRVRIPLLIAEGMVLAMVGDPVEGRAFTRNTSQECIKQLDKAGGRETAMREEAVVSQAHAKASRHPAEHQTDRQARPGEIKGSRQRRAMDHPDPEQHRPIELAPTGGGPVGQRLRGGSARSGGVVDRSPTECQHFLIDAVVQRSHRTSAALFGYRVQHSRARFRALTVGALLMP